MQLPFTRLPYGERAALAVNPTAQALLSLIETKQTNLALSADLTGCDDLLQLADQMGPEICVLKTHVDILTDFSMDFVTALIALAQKHQFMIFEDRKFADIGHTVQHQYADGIYHIADWSPITNAHVVPGPGIIEGLKEVGLAKGNGLLLIAEMSSKGNLVAGSYRDAAVAMALEHPDFVMGFIAQHCLVDEPGFITMTPGVQLQKGSDNLGQQYNTPEYVLNECGSDVIIVGRGIYAASDPLAAAQAYRAASWQAISNSLRK